MNIKEKIAKRKGFTLAELLIVVAIIAVLVAIAIPVFNTHLEKAREATDLANLRAAYAEEMAAYLEWDGSTAIQSKDVEATQRQAGWQSKTHKVGEIDVDASTSGWNVSINSDTGAVQISPK